MFIQKKALFFDRDGILNVDTGYVHRFEEIRWVEGAREAVSRLTKNGWLLFVVTNQSGVARGLYEETDVLELHKKMNDEFNKYGGNIEEFFFCPHLKGAKVPRYDIECNCRKPRPGMILRAMEKYELSAENTFLVGDSPRDVEAAKRAGIQGFLFDENNLDIFLKNHLPM